MLNYTSLTNEIFDTLPDKLKSLYIECFNNQSENELKKAIDEVIKSIITEQGDLKSKDCNPSDMLRNNLVIHRKRKQQQKRRWLDRVTNELENKSEVANFKYIIKEINDIQNMIKKFPQTLKEFQNIDIPEINEQNIIQQRLQDINDWAKSKDSLLFDFIYLKEFTKTQIMKAFESDIKTLVYSHIIINYAGNINAYILEQPDGFFEYPIWGNKTSLELTDKENSSTHTIDKSFEYSNDNNIIEGIISSDSFNNGKKVIKYPALNAEDMELLSTILTFKNSDTLVDKTISIQLSDLIKCLNKSLSGKTYSLIKNQIKALSNITLYVYSLKSEESDNVKVEEIIHFFQHISVHSHEKNVSRDKVVFTISDFIHKQLLDQQTTKVYKKELEALNHDISKILLFKLQKDRLSCYTYNIPYMNSYPYSKLTNFIRFDNNDKKINLDLVNKSLQELKFKKIIVKDFASIKDGFAIEFIPFQDYEIKEIKYIT